MNYGDATQGERADLAVGTMSPVFRLGVGGAGITAIPVSGGTMRVFKSTSMDYAIAADVADGSLSYDNLIAGTQPTRSSWRLWASGAVTALTNEGPAESSSDTAIVATATTQAGVLEVVR